MKHYLVTISPRQGKKIQHKEYQIYMPDWVGKLYLSQYTPYSVEVLYANNTAYKDFGKFELVNSIEELIDKITNLEFFEKRDKLIEIETVEEVRPFKLSACFKIKDVQWNENCYSYINGMTFFKVVAEPPIKDVKFVDEDLTKTLDCALAKSGYYFLYGEWRFFRSKSAPVNWEARKIKRRSVKVGEKIVKLQK